MSEKVLIVGAGIAGLRTALKLKEKYPTNEITLLEKYTKSGGRMDTIKLKDGTHYESGAGRLHTTHKKLLGLIKHYKLTLHKPADGIYWKTPNSPLEPNYFYELWIELCAQFRKLPETTLQTKTLRYLCIELLGVDLAKRILETYPYRAEIEVMSASSALDLYQSFLGGHFCMLEEGYSALTELITKDLVKAGIKIIYNVDINRVDLKNDVYTVSGTKDKIPVSYKASRVILAVHKNALEKIHPFSPTTPLIKKVRMEPLLRVYSQYNDSSWFPDKPVITDTPLRFIIPINKEKGIIMSSYLDSRDIEPWDPLFKTGNEIRMAEKIRNETQDLFPEQTIGTTNFTKSYYWKDGCSYWLPGPYDYKMASKEALNPMPTTHPRLHIVGESFSKKQQWIEGALEHADELVDLL